MFQFCWETVSSALASGVAWCGLTALFLVYLWVKMLSVKFYFYFYIFSTVWILSTTHYTSVLACLLNKRCVLCIVAAHFLDLPLRPGGLCRRTTTNCRNTGEGEFLSEAFLTLLNSLQRKTKFPHSSCRFESEENFISTKNLLKSLNPKGVQAIQPYWVPDICGGTRECCSGSQSLFPLL